LLNIPVALMTGERKTDISFRMLDSRDNSPIRYERVNAETGEEVPWKDIVKAYEYDKGSYVVLEQEDIASAAPESHDAIDVEAFVEAGSIDPRYFEKPYVLVPAKKAEKGYVLLREALEKTGRIGIARVVIRTREHLCAVMPYGNALLLLMMRYPQELVDFDEYAIPEGAKGDYRITPKELAFSEQLIETMSGEFDPKEYRDEFRERLHKVIDERMKAHGVVKRAPEEPEAEEGTATNVVDFMSLLQKSIDRNKRTPAKRASSKQPAAKKPDKPAKAAKTAHKAAAKRAASKPAAKKAPSKARKRA
jgi:DNA end-binding protein Ku